VSDEQAAPAIELHWQPAELRDAVASVTAAVPPGWSYLWPNFKVADAVLAMPEMQAIRKALERLAEIVACEWGINRHDVLEGRFDDDINIGAAGVAWVLEGEQ